MDGRYSSSPESLYSLQLLNQGNFSAVKYADIDTQLGLYDVGSNPIYTLDRATLEGMCQSGLVPGSMDEIMAKTHDAEVILKRVRKSQK